MLILDKPYVSDLNRESVSRMGISVLENDMSTELSKNCKLNICGTENLVKEYKNSKNPLILSNSENSINWISKNLSFTELPEKINLFKNKVIFRDMLKPVYPEFYYEEVQFSDLDSIDPDRLKFPFVIKPSVGFFSMGVYVVDTKEEWPEIVESIKTEMEKVKDLYPLAVMDSSSFIIEEMINGDEFAVDVYFDKNGEPVILDIMKHLFSSGKDVSDRCYITSKEIIEKNFDRMNDLMVKIGKLAGLKNFPILVELRVDAEGKMLPIEVNPMRFSGWATTDLGYYAFGINTTEYFFLQKKPDWNEVLKGKEGKIYSVIIADLPKDIHGKDIEGIDYEKFKNCFSKPLEFREINYREYPVMAFMYSETDKSTFNEIEYMLKSDLREFIELKDGK